MPDEKINPDDDRPERWKALLLVWRKTNGLPDVLAE